MNGNKTSELGLDIFLNLDSVMHYHLERLVCYFLELSGKNSVDLDSFYAYITKALKQLENNQVCFWKEMPNGRIRLFKKYYCCFRLEDWRRCKEWRCIALPCNEDSIEACIIYKRETNEQTEGVQENAEDAG